MQSHLLSHLQISKTGLPFSPSRPDDLFLTVAFGLIGFLDDYLKVVLKRSDGLMPMQKMALQIIVTAVFAFYLVKVADIPLTMLVPFSNGYYLDIG